MTEDRASVVPALLASLGEAAVLYLPLHDVAVNEGRVVAGPMTRYWVFVLAFAVGVALATRLRGFRSLLPVVAVSAVGVGTLQGIWWATGDLAAALVSVVLWLLLAARVFMLALRDWREPIGTSFGVGAGVLLAEVILLGSFAEPRAVLPIAVPQFFLASLASRAASLRLTTRRVTALKGELLERGERSSRLPGARIGMGLVAIAGCAVLMMAAALLGGRDGGLLWLGKLILSVALPILAYVLAPIVKVLVIGLIWLFGLIDIDLSPLRSLAGTIDDFRARPPDASTPGGGPVGRILALLVLLALGYLLVRTIRTRWRRLEGGQPEDELAEAEPISPPGRRRRARRVRRELPADTVRRWYAEALLALERLGLPKAPSWTPGEYLGEVTVAFPECAPGFTALTRAYEDVRYGSLRLDRDTLGRLEANRQRAMSALSRATRREESRREESP